MIQPKFKFGEKVTTLGGNIFKVNEVSHNGEYYLYADESRNTNFYHEEQLEVFQEPKKKKILAYQDKEGFILFFINIPSVIAGRYKRAPEYDIEYP